MLDGLFQKPTLDDVRFGMALGKPIVRIDDVAYAVMRTEADQSLLTLMQVNPAQQLLLPRFFVYDASRGNSVEITTKKFRYMAALELRVEDRSDNVRVAYLDIRQLAGMVAVNLYATNDQDNRSCWDRKVDGIYDLCWAAGVLSIPHSLAVDVPDACAKFDLNFAQLMTSAADRPSTTEQYRPAVRAVVVALLPPLLEDLRRSTLPVRRSWI